MNISRLDKLRQFVDMNTLKRNKFRLKYFSLLVVPLFLSVSFGCQSEEKSPSAQSNSQPPATAEELTTQEEKLSYAIGQEIGQTLGELKEEIDLAALYRGLEDSITGKEPLLTPEQSEQVKLSFLEKLQAEHEQTMAALAEENLKAGEAFLAENKMREDVVTTDSGLQYMVLQEGDGPRPQPNDTVRVHYRGMLLDGTVFDSSYERGEPAIFKVDEVIPGWTEALQHMAVGSRYRLFVPSELAYGAQGAGPLIGPNETLIFEIELLGIGPPEEQNGSDEELPPSPPAEDMRG